MKTPVIPLNRMMAKVTGLVARYVINNPSAYLKEAVMEDCPAGSKTFNAYFLLEQRKSRERYEVSFDVDSTSPAVLKCVTYIGRKKTPLLLFQKAYHVIFPHVGRKRNVDMCFVPCTCVWDGVENGTDLYYEQARKKQKERLEKKRKKGKRLVSALVKSGLS